MTRLCDIGEDHLVARLTASLPGGRLVRVGPGDDCAVIGPERARFWQLLKTDCVVEGVHFTPGEDFSRVGWKALARAVSDIAAMGGLPEQALITVVLPPALPLARVEALYTGLRRCAETFGIAIVGGETSRSPGPVMVSVTLTGRVEARRCVTRSGGRPGDRLFVTGLLGGSLAGKHLDFTPRLEEARWLTRHFRLRAMMDVSDGLGKDLPRLARASGCGCVLETVPCTPGCSREAALGDGEDFELLFALGPRQAARLRKEWPFDKLPLTCIGYLTPNEGCPPSADGFDHFALAPGD